MGGENPDWLPADWKVSVKIRSSGRKDKYFIHSPTGLTFNSKPEVLRYLESSQKMLEQEKNEMDEKKTVVEELPPGWIKKIRTKKSGGKTRRDTYYTDPVSGRQFRSMQEVFRYLKSKDLGEVVPESDVKGMELTDHSQSSSAEAKGQRSIDKKGKNLTDGENIKSGLVAVAPENVEKPLVEESCREDNSVTKQLQNKIPLTNGKEQQNGGRRSSKRLADNRIKCDTEDDSLQSEVVFAGSDPAAENKTNVPESEGLEEREKGNRCKEDPAHQDKGKNKKKKLMNNLPRRTSRRLAHLEADQPVEVNTSTKILASAPLSSEGEVGSTENSATLEQSHELEINTSVKFDIMDPGEQCRTENPPNDAQKEAISLEKASPEGVHHEEQKHKEHFDSTLKVLLMDPCIAFAIKTLTGDIPIEYVNKVDENPVSSLASSNQTSGSSSLSPSGDIWSDPCFEFAVKTLTGEMPSEDGLQCQISYEKPVSQSNCSSSGQSDAKQQGLP